MKTAGIYHLNSGLYYSNDIANYTDRILEVLVAGKNVYQTLKCPAYVGGNGWVAPAVHYRCYTPTPTGAGTATGWTAWKQIH